jgi:hypothetical protein
VGELCNFIFSATVLATPEILVSQGLGTDESALIEVLCGRTNAEIYALRDLYRRSE